MLPRLALPHGYRALRQPYFRFYFFGLLTSAIGSWMELTAQSWLIYRMTHSAWLLGLVAFANQFPIFIFGLFGGVLADRFPRRKLVIIGQTLDMLQAFAVAFLTLTHRITVGELLFFAAFSGVASSFEIPARHSFMIEMVGTEALPSAIALNSTAFMTARIIGPPLAAFVIHVWSEGGCFLINAVSFLAVLAALLMVRVAVRPLEKKIESPLHSLREGLVYAYRFLPLRVLLILLAIINFIVGFYTALMPVFADTILGRGASGLGILMGALGFGALIGVSFIGVRASVKGLSVIISRASFAFSLALLFFSISRIYPVSIFLLGCIGLGLMVQNVSTTTLIQSIVPNHLRGRLMSMYVLMVVGMPPLGSLFAGWIAAGQGATLTVAAAGVFGLFGALWFNLTLPKMRPILKERFAALSESK